MAFRVHLVPRPGQPAEPPLLLEADQHCVEGGFHVFRSTTLVLGRPREVVVRRLPAAHLHHIEPA